MHQGWLISYLSGWEQKNIIWSIILVMLIDLNCASLLLSANVKVCFWLRDTLMTNDHTVWRFCSFCAASHLTWGVCLVFWKVRVCAWVCSKYTRGVSVEHTDEGRERGSTVNKWQNNTIRHPRAATCEREIGWSKGTAQMRLLLTLAGSVCVLGRMHIGSKMSREIITWSFRQLERGRDANT